MKTNLPLLKRNHIPFTMLRNVCFIAFCLVLFIQSNLYSQCVTDRDGNSYNVVKIGDQVWMKENLATTKYNDGTPIPLVKDNTAWSNLSIPGYCYYNNDSLTYATTYGPLYNLQSAL